MTILLNSKDSITNKTECAYDKCNGVSPSWPGLLFLLTNLIAFSTSPTLIVGAAETTLRGKDEGEGCVASLNRFAK